MLPRARLPAIDPCRFISVPQKKGISFSLLPPAFRPSTSDKEHAFNLSVFDRAFENVRIESPKHLLRPCAVESYEDDVVGRNLRLPLTVSMEVRIAVNNHEWNCFMKKYLCDSSFQA